MCTTAGAVAAGRRRLRAMLLAPAWVMLALALFTWFRGRIFPGLLCLGVAGVLVFAWRMANQLEPLYFEVQGDRLEVRLRWQLFHIDLAGARARELTAEEKRHLERLASVGGLVATSGGYDSHRLGEFDLYASNLDKAVLLEAGESRFIVTPDNPSGFVEAVGRLSAR